MNKQIIIIILLAICTHKIVGMDAAAFEEQLAATRSKKAAELREKTTGRHERSLTDSRKNLRSPRSAAAEPAAPPPSPEASTSSLDDSSSNNRDRLTRETIQESGTPYSPPPLPSLNILRVPIGQSDSGSSATTTPATSQRANPNPTTEHHTSLTRERIIYALLASWALTEATLVYKNFDQTEWEQLSYLQRSRALIARTAQKMFWRPIGFISCLVK